MNARDDVNVMISDWLVEEAGRTTPDYLDAILARTSRTRQRPAWSSLERWLPVQLTFRRTQPIPRLALTIALLVALALLAAALLAAGVGRRPLPHFGAQANGEIAFIDGSNLKVAGADGSRIRISGSVPASVESMTFSPDGTRLAYRTTGTPSSIIVADSDGSHPVVVTTGTTVAEPVQVATSGPFSWSPDSGRLAFAAVVSTDVRTIDVVSVDGSHLTELFPGTSAETVDRFDPAWSPDGQWISFFTTDANHAISIAVIHPDGTGALRLGTFPPDPAYLEMSWSPDPAQRRLEYVASGGVRIFDMNAADTNTFVGAGFWGSWSPDAKRIAWWSNGIRIALVDDVLAKQSRHFTPFPPISTNPCSGSPELAGKSICSPADWSPDSKLVFGPDVLGTSFVFGSVDGSKPSWSIPLDQPTNDTGGNGSAAWQPIAP